MFDDDWLTSEHKQQHLRSLNYAIAAAERGDEADEPVDLEFVPYLKRMNRIPWIVTNQCCTGHHRPLKWGEFFRWILRWKVWNPLDIWGHFKHYGYGSGWEHDGHLSFDVTRDRFLEVVELVRMMCELGKFENIWISGKPGETSIGNICVWFYRHNFPHVVVELIEELEKMDARRIQP